MNFKILMMNKPAMAAVGLVLSVAAGAVSTQSASADSFSNAKLKDLAIKVVSTLYKSPGDKVTAEPLLTNTMNSSDFRVYLRNANSAAQGSAIYDVKINAKKLADGEDEQVANISVVYVGGS